MNTKRLLALNIATQAHKGQKRKGGKDYISHPIAVATIATELWSAVVRKHKLDVDGRIHTRDLSNIADDIYITAILHDTVEDTSITLEDIIDGFGEDIGGYVYTVTRKPEQNYFDFIKGITYTGMIVPVIVKIADLEHNMHDLPEGSMKDKYRFAHAMLTNSIT